MSTAPYYIRHLLQTHFRHLGTTISSYAILQNCMHVYMRVGTCLRVCYCQQQLEELYFLQINLTYKLNTFCGVAKCLKFGCFSQRIRRLDFLFVTFIHRRNTDTLLHPMAMSRAFSPWRSRLVTSAPRSSRSFTTDTWPFFDARWSPVSWNIRNVLQRRTYWTDKYTLN